MPGAGAVAYSVVVDGFDCGVLVLVLLVDCSCLLAGAGLVDALDFPNPFLSLAAMERAWKL